MKKNILAMITAALMLTVLMTSCREINDSSGKGASKGDASSASGSSQTVDSTAENSEDSGGSTPPRSLHASLIGGYHYFDNVETDEL